MTAKQKKAAGKTAGQSTGFFSGRNLAILGGIMLLTYLAYSPALKNGFINWDDNAYVFDNMHIGRPLTEAVAYFFGPNYFVGNYIPVTMVVYALEYKIAGMNPKFFHLVNILIHLLNVFLVFRLSYLLSSRKIMVAALVALFFGLHPMHTESVVWIAELKDVLYSFFFLAGLISYFHYALARSNAPPAENGMNKKLPVFPWAAFVLFIFSVLAKPAAVVFPLVLGLIDFYLRRRPDRRVWMEKLPFLLVSLIFGLIAIRAQQADQLLHHDYSLAERLFFASFSFLSYLVKIFYPFRQAIFHPYPVEPGEVLPWVYYLSPLLVLALCFLVFRTLRRTRLFAFGFLFFAFNLILVLQFLTVGNAMMADRYTYLAYIGPFFILAMGIEAWFFGQKGKYLRYRTALSVMLLALIVVSAWRTSERTRVWRDDDTIATDLLAAYPDDWLALNNKGFILQNQGRYQEAIPLYDRAIAIKPDYVRPYINLINTYEEMNYEQKAFETADSALARVPGDHHLLNRKGYLLFRRQRYAEALAFHEEAKRRKKDYVGTYLSLSECYYQMGEYDKGIAAVDTALSFEPENYILLNNKGYFLFLKKEYRQAEQYYKAALQRKPDYSTARINLENCYQVMNEPGNKQE